MLTWSLARVPVAPPYSVSMRRHSSPSRVGPAGRPRAGSAAAPRGESLARVPLAPDLRDAEPATSAHRDRLRRVERRIALHEPALMDPDADLVAVAGIAPAEADASLQEGAIGFLRPVGLGG